MADKRPYNNECSDSGDHKNATVKKSKNDDDRLKDYIDTGHSVCSICFKVFLSVSGYDNHMKSHEESFNECDTNKLVVMKLIKQVPENYDFNDKLHYRRVDCMNTIQIPSTSVEYRDQSDFGEISGLHRQLLRIIKRGLSETFAEEALNIETNRRIIQPATSQLTTVAFRTNIQHLARNDEQQLMNRIRSSSNFTLFVGETMCASNFMNFIVIVRYKFHDTIAEDLLYWEPIEAITNSLALFTNLIDFIALNRLDWNKCAAICVDGIGDSEPLNDFKDFITTFGLDTKLVNIFSRRDILVRPNMTDDLKQVMRDAIQIINILKHKDELQFDKEMNEGFGSTLQHTVDYWLAHGKTLSRLVEMREQCKQMAELEAYHEKFQNLDWLYRLAYLVDIFEQFHDLDDKLQRNDCSVFHAYDKINAEIEKLEKHRDNLLNINMAAFPNLQKFVSDPMIPMPSDHITKSFQDDLSNLKKCLAKYSAPAKILDCKWIKNPFNTSIDVFPKDFSHNEIDQLIELRNDSFLVFETDNLETFWIKAYKNYPALSDRALRELLVFKNGRTFNMAFATFLTIKSGRLTNPENMIAYLRLKMTTSVQPI